MILLDRRHGAPLPVLSSEQVQGAYLRSGRADIYRFAEAMTRHTGEVDVYHLGKWADLGTRHGVQHFGDSAKQVRISTPVYRRLFYYLTADERTGDLMRAPLFAGRHDWPL